MNYYSNDFADFMRRQAVSVSAATLSGMGCTLHSAGADGWDVETPIGWRTARDGRELWAIVEEIRSKPAS